MILLFTFYFFTLSLCLNHNVMEFWALLLLFYNALITDYEKHFSVMYQLQFLLTIKEVLTEQGGNMPNFFILKSR